MTGTPKGAANYKREHTFYMKLYSYEELIASQTWQEK